MKKLTLLVLWLVPFFCFAGPPDESPEDTAKQIQAILSKLHFQKGPISLKGDLATLNLPSEYRYLSPDDANFVLHDLWENPKAPDILGMIVPSEKSIFQRDGFAVVITYMDDGYVKDSDAAKIDYTKMMKDLQAATKDANKEREKEGYKGIELVGWAKPPYYDNATHKMYWAKEIRFVGSPENTLNYNIRVLGRSGVLVLNIVAPMSILPELDKQLTNLVAMADFNSGKRYADFNKSTDKVAAYGLAALVAGGIAAKAGLFKVLWVGILALKKFIIIGVIALSGFIKKLFNRKPSPPSSPPSTPTFPNT